MMAFGATRDRGVVPRATDSNPILGSLFWIRCTPWRACAGAATLPSPARGAGSGWGLAAKACHDDPNASIAPTVKSTRRLANSGSIMPKNSNISPSPSGGGQGGGYTPREAIHGGIGEASETGCSGTCAEAAAGWVRETRRQSSTGGAPQNVAAVRSPGEEMKESLEERVAQLTAMLEAQRQELAEQRQRLQSIESDGLRFPSGGAQGGSAQAHSRRDVLRLAGAAMAGAAGSVALQAVPASAMTTGNMVLGQANDANATTGLFPTTGSSPNPLLQINASTATAGDAITASAGSGATSNAIVGTAGIGATSSGIVGTPGNGARFNGGGGRAGL